MSHFDITPVLQAISYPFVGLIGAGLSYAGTRGMRQTAQQQADIQRDSLDVAEQSGLAQQLTAVLSAADMWRNQAEYWRGQVEDLRGRADKLEEQMRTQKTEHDALLATKDGQIGTLTEQVSVLQGQVTELQRAASAKTTTTITTTTEPVPGTAAEPQGAPA